eukprot:Skav225192  [mRNA]  locus=scaffold3065:104098:108644:+ [translate_table: standard]
MKVLWSFYVIQCPVQALYDSVHHWSWRHRDNWISIEEAEPGAILSWFQVFQRRAKYAPSAELPKPHLRAVCSQEVNTEFPFPCSQQGCAEYHNNMHGFCRKHRFNHMSRKAYAFLMKSLQWLELTILLSIQAAAEIQSRVLLLTILLSLLPVTCIFLERATGIPSASVCITMLVVAVGTCLITAKRLDAMQQAIFNAGLATEAKYFQVLQPLQDLEENSKHLVELSTILNRHSDDTLQEVPHTKEGLKEKYIEARRHATLFQSLVCDPLACVSSEVFAMIKPVAELDEKEALGILHCEVWCDSLQHVQRAWEVLEGLDVQIVIAQDFFAVASSRKCIRIVVNLQGCFATVFLLETSLSSLQTEKGALEVANSLGLLDKTQAESWETAQFQGDYEIPRCVLVATAFLRLVAFCLSVIAAIAIHSLHTLSYYGEDLLSRREELLNLWTFARALPFWTCAAILLWEMRCCCCCICWKRRRFRARPRPTQVWYRKYFGIQGRHYAFKVVALQLITVVIQGVAKASLFATIHATRGSEPLKSSTAVYCFVGLLVCNIIFPALVFLVPNAIFSRVLAALMDAVLDFGYIITSVWLYILFATPENLDDIFVKDFFNYAALYMCTVHVLCVCRSLETADWAALLQVPRAKPIWGAWKRTLFSTMYACSLMVFVGLLLGGSVVGSKEVGQCPPCQCSSNGSGSLLLERCFIPTSYVAKAALPIEFNLTNRNIREVMPDAFFARGVHQQVSFLSLRGNHLTALPEGLFMDLLEPMRHSYWDMDVMDLAHNRLTVLPQGIFQSGSSSRVHIAELYLEGNDLTVLKPELFNGLCLNQLRIQNNKLTQLHPESFRGLSFRNKYDQSILDLSGNKLQELPPKVFDGLRLNQLRLQDNDLTLLHPESFQGIKFAVHRLYGIPLTILDLSRNKLQELPPKVFAGVKVKRLHIQNNSLTSLHPESFRGFTSSSGWYAFILDLSGNKLQELPPNVFAGVKVITLRIQNNELTQLHPESFRGLSFYNSFTMGTLDLSRNKLQELPPKVFDGLFLEQLLLQNNDLTLLRPESFQGIIFESSEWVKSILDLSGNKLQELPPKVFDGWCLNQLRLQNNDLTQLHPESFRGLSFRNKYAQSILDLSGNKLQELPPKVFDGSRLNQLLLQDNDLTQLHPESFHGINFTGCGWLDLSGNKLQELRAKVFDGLVLERLRLQDNDLTQLHPESFRGLSFYCGICGYDQCILDLSRNKLQELSPTAFDGLWFWHATSRSSSILDLSSNRLKALPAGFGGLRWVDILKLEGNLLAILPPQVFEGVGMRQLSRRNNSLTELHPESFVGLFLQTLDLSWNRLQVLSPRVFQWGLQGLRDLNLEENQLTDLPVGIFSYSGSLLRNLQLQRNQLMRLPQQVFQILGLTSALILQIHMSCVYHVTVRRRRLTFYRMPHETSFSGGRIDT